MELLKTPGNNIMPGFSLDDLWWMQPQAHRNKSGEAFTSGLQSGMEFALRRKAQETAENLRRNEIANKTKEVGLKLSEFEREKQRQGNELDDLRLFRDWAPAYAKDQSVEMPEFRTIKFVDEGLKFKNSVWEKELERSGIEARIATNMGITNLLVEDRPKAFRLLSEGRLEELQEYLNDKAPRKRKEEFEKEKELKLSTSSSTWTTMTDRERADYTHKLVTNRDKLRARLEDITQEKELTAKALENTKLSVQAKYIDEASGVSEIQRLQKKLESLNDEFDSLTKGNSSSIPARSSFGDDAELNADDYINSILK